MAAMVESLQRSAGNAAVSRLLDGEALPPGAQGAAERRLGSDLSGVRVHTDAASASLAEELGAEAVTLGRDVFLSPRAGGMESSRGRKALMHELVHTVQSDGSSAPPLAGVSSPSSAAEMEASAIGRGGFSGPLASPTAAAPAGVAHRKVPDDEEKPADEKMPDFLNPQPITDDEVRADGGTVAPKAGELGENESIAFEIRVMQPMRSVQQLVDGTEWEQALNEINALGQAVWEYEQAYEKRNPSLVAELRGIRGWLALAANQIKGRFAGNSFTDQHISELIKESTFDLGNLGKRLDSPS